MKTYYRIHFSTSARRGFFSLFASVIGHLYTINKTNPDFIPYVFDDSMRNPYYQVSGDYSCGNMWEQYYEQITHNTCDIKNDLKNNLAKEVLSNGKHVWYRENRKHISGETFTQCIEIIKKYIKLKPHLSEEIEEHYSNMLKGYKTLAVHYRGTDKEQERTRPNVENYVKYVTNLLNNKKYDKVLICSDEEDVINYFKKTFVNNIIVIDDIYRCKSGFKGGPWSTNEITPYKKGRDIILETYLMSRCDGFIRYLSNVSDFVTIFNEKKFEDNILLR